LCSWQVMFGVQICVVVDVVVDVGVELGRVKMREK
jgi:hypothetical protein